MRDDLRMHPFYIIMKIVTNNPYRIAGILANSSEKDLLKQRAKIKRFTEVGKEIASEYDFPFFSSLQRSNNHIDKAFSDIEQNQDKVTHSLFWFINLNPIDNTAIQYLISGNKEKAFEIWEKLTDGKEVNSKNFSAFNNVGTLYLLEESKDKQKQGITAKIKLVESGNFKDFINTVADETFTIESEKQIEILIDELLMQFKNSYSIADTIDLFSNCNGTTQKYLSKKFTEEPIHKIETQIEQTKNKRIKDKINASHLGTDLYKNTKDELTQLKSILSATNLQYKMLADNVAKEVLQCSIDYFNESQEQEKSNNYLDEAMKLVKLADRIAVNKITKDRIKDNINTLEEMKDKELSQAIELLKSVKAAYETNKTKITAEVRMQELTLSLGQSINWSKVNQMIENSINWNKVVELVKEVIPQRNIEKIKLSEKQAKVTEYKYLVDFLLGKLSYSQKNQVQYLCYWKAVSTTPLTPASPTSTYKPTTTTSSNSGGCYIATMAYGSYEHPQVMILRQFRDDVLYKSVLGRWFIKFYYHYSPKLVEVLKDKQFINKSIRSMLNQFIKVIK